MATCVLVSGTGTILEAICDGAVQVELVVADRQCRGLEVAAGHGIDAVLVAPCDQPALSAGAIDVLWALHRASGRTAAARYSGRNGAPAIFGRGDFGRLLGLSGDEGARMMLNSDSEKVSTVEMPELALDLDTPDDVRRWAGGDG